MSIEATSALLAQVFPEARVSDLAYLRWLYEESPFGPVVETNLDDELGRAGHYALVPIELAVDGEAQRGALSLNTAVHERARGGGTFTRLATETIEAARAQGVALVVGVANANSTPGFLRRLEFELAGPLPVRVLVPTPGRRAGVRSAWANAGAFAAGGAAAGVDELLRPPASGTARAWTSERLRWRLASPGARYALHRTDDALVVSTATRERGVPVAVLLKAFARRSLSPAETSALVRAACRFHRAPLSLHAGIHDAVAFRGPPLPDRLRPSPLNLIVRRLDDHSARPVARFELLDFDAY